MGGGSGSIAPTHSQPWHYKSVSGQHHDLVTLPWVRPSTYCTGGEEVGWALVYVRMGMENLTPTGIQSSVFQVGSELLYKSAILAT